MIVDTCRTISPEDGNFIHVSVYRTVPQSPFVPQGWQTWSYDRLRIELIVVEAETMAFNDNGIAFPPCGFPVPPNWQPFFFGGSRLGAYRQAILKRWGHADTVIPHVNPASKTTVAYSLITADMRGRRAKTESEREARRHAAAILRSIGARNRSQSPDLPEDISMKSAKTAISRRRPTL